MLLFQHFHEVIQLKILNIFPFLFTPLCSISLSRYCIVVNNYIDVNNYVFQFSVVNICFSAEHDAKFRTLSIAHTPNLDSVVIHCDSCVKLFSSQVSALRLQRPIFDHESVAATSQLFWN